MILSIRHVTCGADEFTIKILLFIFYSNFFLVIFLFLIVYIYIIEKFRESSEIILLN